MTEAVTDKCSNEYCNATAHYTLINGSETSRLCDDCLREMAAGFVLDNDRVIFEWDADHNVVTLGN